MVKSIIIKLFTLVLEQLNSDVLKKVIDTGLDVVEDKVAQTPNKIDDAIVLPLCKKIREAFDIPDND